MNYHIVPSRYRVTVLPVSAVAALLVAAVIAMPVSYAQHVGEPEVPAIRMATSMSRLYTPVPAPEPTPAPYIWNVSTGNSDMTGNVLSIVRFCTTQWYDALDWLQQNYKESWPYGYPCEANPRRDMTLNMSVAIATNAVRESRANPSAVQGGGEPSYSNVRGAAVGLWQVDGGIRHNYLRFADSLGKPYDDLETQLYFLAYSYYSTGAGFYQRWQGAIESCQLLPYSVDNCIKAAEAFRVHWEVGGSAGVNAEIIKTWGNRWDVSTLGQKPEGGIYAFCSEEVVA